MRERLAIGALMAQAFVLAVLELFFLPLRLDGTLLPRIDDYQFPVTALVAIITTPLLVLAASWYARRALVAAAPLLVWLGTLLFFGLFGPGGDVMLVNDWRSLLLFAGGALPSAVAVGAFMGRQARAGDH
ncbi:hypothetical protein FHS29_002792 [Saccharothrix tamanrassetensis]|uniref:Uncharacterized protein n=1 Tax=Saccharothrix tamanrassetensis TaxID=1051531 RepID=A0A841CKS0_9PSEU|nr:hypothetical protein [Saccharothrix tamanrassetensis]MBB5956206.1 hypothetical protein [Saccharothrix tamanrassetensis]